MLKCETLAAFVCLVQFVCSGVKAVSRTLVLTKQLDRDCQKRTLQADSGSFCLWYEKN